jgi:hypothetical protein
MSSLTHIEKQKLERELGMESGYVLGFSNRTFEEFFREAVGVEIYDPKFAAGSGSKALIEGWSLYAGAPMPDTARELFKQILAKLVPAI